MRPKLLAAISVLVAIAVAGGIYLRSSSSPDASRPARSYAFEMCVTRGARSAEQHWTDPVLAAVARTITNGERTALEEALAISATRWEARANPFLEDIDDSSPDAPLEAWLEGAPAFVRTAQAAARIHACAPDGFCARPRTGGACPDGWTRAENEGETGRARFLVWPWGHALRMRAPSETDARRAAILLRSRIHGSGRIALVLAADDMEVTKREPFAKLRELWGRRAALRKSVRHEDDRGPEHDDTLPALDPRELVVLPRLETIADDRAFEAEVTNLAQKLEPVR